VEPPFLEVLGSCLDTVLGISLWVALLEQGELDQMTSGGPFQPQTFWDSVKQIMLTVSRTNWKT